MNTPSGISTGTLYGLAWLTVEGRGSFQNSPELKDLVREGLSQGRSRMVLDLQRCSGMDSTFMGMLSCLAGKLETAGGSLHVVNAAGKNADLLRGLGLDEVFIVEEGMALIELGAAALPGPVEVGQALAMVPKSPCTPQNQAEICLEAHEALSQLLPLNADKVRDVVALMRQKTLAPEVTSKASH